MLLPMCALVTTPVAGVKSQDLKKKRNGENLRRLRKSAIKRNGRNTSTFSRVACHTLSTRPCFSHSPRFHYGKKRCGRREKDGLIKTKINCATSIFTSTLSGNVRFKPVVVEIVGEEATSRYGRTTRVPREKRVEANRLNSRGDGVVPSKVSETLRPSATADCMSMYELSRGTGEKPLIKHRKCKCSRLSRTSIDDLESGKSRLEEKEKRRESKRRLRKSAIKRNGRNTSTFSHVACHTFSTRLCFSHSPRFHYGKKRCGRREEDGLIKSKTNCATGSIFTSTLTGKCPFQAGRSRNCLAGKRRVVADEQHECLERNDVEANRLNSPGGTAKGLSLVHAYRFEWPHVRRLGPNSESEPKIYLSGELERFLFDR
ncbi:hypothetical protein DBV15_06713 [Temnothorax longispinosus]|uniref:Uncharacterized protein n=1 Tax=Temnothorax longispinosus TaxID=300112 RepID=A0A4S2KZG9_9HYME|nr:hypothetical protein DBV15_06713 [Temnothorax longispinosus]